MQFFNSLILSVTIFAAAVAASPAFGPCKPLLQSCSVNAECCADLCVAGELGQKILSSRDYKFRDR
ncbi:hypothetical protein BDQ12DRAFT_728682 [Crucibulum laeve]|uniref:Uncharacterized protein n=1 Tax=Crucibulum laeve TaxID=68775 RepID=A0A5C3LHZ3_9AGAR|nr:hypothetical protein BDQ12DRAFT_728682 [Crucibulum laeve]